MKQVIELRGLSNLPSDRKTADGGLDICVNAQLENGEIAPMPAPKDMTGSVIDPQSGLGGILYYVHETSSGKYPIVLDGKEIKSVVGDVTEYRVVFPTVSNNINVIKLISEATGNGLKWSKQFANSEDADKYLSFTSEEQATSLVSRLADHGYTATLETIHTPGPAVVTLYELRTNENLIQATSLGKFIILLTNINIHYLLLGDNGYTYLGTRIPYPEIKIQEEHQDEKSYLLNSSEWDMESELKNILSGLTSFGVEGYKDKLAEVINFVCEQIESPDQLITINSKKYTPAEFINYLSNAIWGRVKLMRIDNRNDGCFSAPTLLRVAIKLYDGNYISQTVPYLLGAGSSQVSDKWANVYMSRKKSDSSFAGFRIVMRDIYKASISIRIPGMSKWRDLISSVDVFVSTDVATPAVNARIDGIGQLATGTDDYTEAMVNFYQERDIVEELADKSQFYKILSIPASEITDDWPESVNGNTIYTDIIPQGADELIVQDELPDDALSAHESAPISWVDTFNSRLSWNGVRHTLFNGPYFTNGPEDSPSYSFMAILSMEDGSKRSVVLRDFYSYSIQRFKARGWIYYPDPRCREMQVWDGEKRCVLKMKEHPRLSGAYWAGSIESDLPLVTPATGNSYSKITISEDNRKFEEPGKLWMSDVANPFVYPITGRLNIGGNLYRTVPTMVALAPGQLLANDLYAFSSEGIWTIELSDTGLPARTRSLSRDAAWGPRSIQPIERGVVFVGKSNVNLIEQGNITSLSDYMSGKAKGLEGLADPSLRRNIISCTNGAVCRAAEDTDVLIEYMRDAFPVYDSRGSRMIFFNPDHSWSYVFCFNGATWHKMVSDRPTLPVMVANNGIVSVKEWSEKAGVLNKDTYRYRQFDYSTPDMQDRVTLPMLMVTRPLNLSTIDALKSITDIRLRHTIAGTRDNIEREYLVFGSSDNMAELANIMTSLDLPGVDVDSWASGTTAFRADYLSYEDLSRMLTGNTIINVRESGADEPTRHVFMILQGSMDNKTWYDIKSLRGRAFRYHRLAILAMGLKPTDRISYAEVEYIEKMTNRMR